MSWSKPETKGTVPLPRSLHTASVIGNKYGVILYFGLFFFLTNLRKICTKKSDAASFLKMI